MSTMKAVPSEFIVSIVSSCSSWLFRRHVLRAAELIYFSRCILDGIEPEPSGEDGLQDVRIVTALYESAEIGRAVQLPPYQAGATSRCEAGDPSAARRQARDGKGARSALVNARRR
jgi:hypothetical protein